MDPRPRLWLRLLRAWDYVALLKYIRLAPPYNIIPHLVATVATAVYTYHAGYNQAVADLRLPKPECHRKYVQTMALNHPVPPTPEGSK